MIKVGIGAARRSSDTVAGFVAASIAEAAAAVKGRQGFVAGPDGVRAAVAVSLFQKGPALAGREVYFQRLAGINR